VFGREIYSRWIDHVQALPVVMGNAAYSEEKEVWDWLRNPLPPAVENPLFATLRLQLGMADQAFYSDRGFGSLGFLEQQAVGQAMEPAPRRKRAICTRSLKSFHERNPATFSKCATRKPSTRTSTAGNSVPRFRLVGMWLIGFRNLGDNFIFDFLMNI
jgi:hypothetical protein